MAAYIRGKKSWIKCIISLFSAAGAVFLAFWLLRGPRLLPHYDLLLRRRPSPPVSREILIIDAPEEGNTVLEPSAAASVLLTLTEMKAEALIIQTPVLGLSTPSSGSREEILARFDEEFSLLGRNIRNLFEAIRLGSIGPLEAAGYVGELVELTQGGKERLISTFVQEDEAGGLRLERAARLFGAVKQSGDLWIRVIRAEGAGEPGGLSPGEGEYFRARPDRDGVLRRVFPVLPERYPGDGPPPEHIVYSALKGRYRSSELEHTREGPVLRIEEKTGRRLSLPLDREGALLFEVPHRGEDFRRLPLTDFLRYEEMDRRLRRLLEEAENRGIFQGLPGEEHPLYLCDHAEALREELLEGSVSPGGSGGDSPGAGRDRETWIEARNRYIESLDRYLYGPAEMNFVAEYEEILAAENLREPEALQIASQRDGLIRGFHALREGSKDLMELRQKLEAGLSASFCILAPGGDGGDAGASALLANSLLTGRAIKPGPDSWVLAAGLLWALLSCLGLRRLGLFHSLLAGLLFILLGLFLGASVFILGAAWYDPLIPAAGAGTGALISALYALGQKIQFRRRFRFVYGPFVSPVFLRRIIRAGRPLPEEILMVNAAVAAVRNPRLFSREDRGLPHAGARSALAFHQSAAEYFKKAGGVVVGCEGDLILACFGSPLERIALDAKRGKSPYKDTIHARSTPAVLAAGFIQELLKLPQTDTWHFALDSGECCFTWSSLSGYSAFGRPVVRARILSDLAARYHVRVVLSSQANGILMDMPTRKLDVLREKDGEAETFYELLTKP
jgi:hypothetical protein